MKKTLLLFIVMFFALRQNAQTQNNTSITARIDSLVPIVMNDWKIPGMAVAVIKNNDVIFKKGFGTKSPEEFLPVDENTVFQIGSVSKSFTAALIAMLVDEGKLNWHDKIIDHLPDFRMYDSLATKSMQIRDIMTHRSGLRGQAGTYIPNMGYDRDDIYSLLKYIKPSTELRSTYAYNNITFIIAAKLIEKYTGKSWEENVSERIFKPLGMTNSSMNEDGFLNSENRSMSCEFEYDNGIKNKWLYDDDRALFWLTVIGPAGSINSTATDLIKWSKFHLNKGKVDGKEIISEKNMKYLHTGQIITSMDSARITVYGHCWFIEQTNRYRLYFHTGTTWGFTTLCAFIPEIDLGVVILANSESPEGPRYTIMRNIIDWFMFGKAEKDYHAEMFGKFINEAEEETKKKNEKEKDKIIESFPHDTWTYNSFADIYHNEILGDAVIKVENEKLFITIGKQRWTSELQHVDGLSKFEFRMQGHAFPLEFLFDCDAVSGFKVDFGYGEISENWTKANTPPCGKSPDKEK
ncbi:MAG: beta-lactamase family protein [Prevotellaceae bacterium]|jgi:CubicO group peptidase (beta-lactamase class C family)|nr:beta-lactamase family protein [Prevotellaceae bacterium]